MLCFQYKGNPAVWGTGLKQMLIRVENRQSYGPFANVLPLKTKIYSKKELRGGRGQFCCKSAKITVNKVSHFYISKMFLQHSTI